MKDTKIRRALLPLSADPITFGHVDLITRSAAMCDELLIAVMNNDLKAGSYLFTLEERAAMTERSVREAGVTNARVIASRGLLTDIYMTEDCGAIVRGIRNDADRAYEEYQMRIHASILPAASEQILYLPADPKLSLISSSLVKGLVARGLDVSGYVAAFVKRRIEEKILRQYKIAVTGAIAVGKTSVAAALTERWKTRTGTDAWHINIDQLLRDLYAEDSLGAQALRNGLANRFGTEVLKDGGRDVDRAALAARLFDPACPRHLREEIHAVTAPHIERKYREALAGKEGLIVLEWAQLAEMAMSHWTNHNAIVIDSPDRAFFAELRGIAPERLTALADLQWSADRKAERLSEAALRAGAGTVLRHLNRKRATETERADDIDRLTAEVETLFPRHARRT